MKRFALVFMACVAVLIPSIALSAGDGIDVIFSNARDYIPAPGGTLAVLTYYKHISSDSIFQGGNKVSSASLTANVGLFRPVYYLEAGPLVIDPQFIIPFGDISLGTPGASDSSFTGIGDPIIFATFWFLHDNASMTYLGFTPFFTVPGGQYSRQDSLSHVLAGNRWKFQQELGFVKGFRVIPDHNAYIELHLGGVFQTDNDNSTNPVTGLRDTKSTEPIFKLESHLSYDVTKSFMISGDFYYQNGGKDSFNGVNVPFSKLEASTIGGTLAYNIAPGFQAMFQYTHDIDVENGFKAQTILFRLLYACDLESLVGKRK